jgi:integrase-like protein
MACQVLFPRGFIEKMRFDIGNGKASRTGAGFIPNPKLKLLEQVREVMRLRHYAIRTERCYCDWIRRYIKFHAMGSKGQGVERGKRVYGPPLPGPLLRWGGGEGVVLGDMGAPR